MFTVRDLRRQPKASGSAARLASSVELRANSTPGSEWATRDELRFRQAPECAAARPPQSGRTLDPSIRHPPPTCVRHPRSPLVPLRLPIQRALLTPRASDHHVCRQRQRAALDRGDPAPAWRSHSPNHRHAIGQVRRVHPAALPGKLAKVGCGQAAPRTVLPCASDPGRPRGVAHLRLRP